MTARALSAASLIAGVAMLSASAQAENVDTLSPQSAQDLANGGKLSYGVSLSLLRLSFSRQEDEPARIRNYTPRLERIAPEVGFQFAYAPASDPFRLKTRTANGDGYFQLMSFGGAFLVRLSDQNVSRGGVSVAAIVGFFDDRVSVGMGFDIYRGIPVANVDGMAGAGTAYTGLASWAFAREGELTPENVFLVFSINLAKIGGEK
jgi:hypothetical protein